MNQIKPKRNTNEKNIGIHCTNTKRNNEISPCSLLAPPRLCAGCRVLPASRHTTPLPSHVAPPPARPRRACSHRASACSPSASTCALTTTPRLAHVVATGNRVRVHVPGFLFRCSRKVTGERIVVKEGTSVFSSTRSNFFLKKVENLT
jgi:hypothetical protein